MRKIETQAGNSLILLAFFNPLGVLATFLLTLTCLAQLTCDLRLGIKGEAADTYLRRLPASTFGHRATKGDIAMT